MTDLESFAVDLQRAIDERLRVSRVPGYVAGIRLGDQVIRLAGGLANLNTGAAMTTDTAFLIGSITKPIFTSLLLRQVERGLLALDDRVATLLSELHLSDRETLERMTVRDLLNHSCGIDAADFFPELGKGADMVQRYVAALDGTGQVHPLRRRVSYCNAAFCIAGRILELLTGEEFDSLLKRDLVEPFGLARACTSGDEAILHRTAIGHIVDQGADFARPTRTFMLAYAGAPAGTTIIGTVDDLLRFAQIHLDGGVTPEGDRILSEASVNAMATETIKDSELYDLGVGLGWQLPTFGGTHVLAHYGGSYGGVSSIMVVPEKRFAFAAFGNSTEARPIHEYLHEIICDELLGIPGADTVARTHESIDPARYVGTYERQNIRTVVTAGAEGGLVARVSHLDEGDDRAARKEYGGYDELPPQIMQPATDRLFLAEGDAIDPVPVPHAVSSGWTFLDPDENGHFRYVSTDRRVSRFVGSAG